MADCLRQKARVSELLGRFKRADAEIREAIQTEPSTSPERIPAKADSLILLGSISIDLAAYDAAERTLHEALALVEQRDEFAGSAADAYRALASVDSRRSLYAECRRDQQKAIELERRIIPRRPERLARSFTSMALADILLARYPDARQEIAAAKRLQDRWQPRSHPDRVDTLYSLGLIAESEGHPRAALDFYEEGVSLGESTLSPTHPALLSTLQSLAALKGEYGDQRGRADLLERARRIAETTYGAHHPASSDVHYGLGLAAANEGRYAEAERVLRQSLRIERDFFREASYSVLTTKLALVDLFLNTHRIPLARRAIDSLLPPAVSLLGERHPYVSKAWTYSGLIYQEEGKPVKMLAALQRAKDIDLGTYPPTHLEIAVNWNNLGCAYSALDRHEEAIAAFQKAYSIEAESFGSRSAVAGWTLSNLAAALHNAGQEQKAWATITLAHQINRETLLPTDPQLSADDRYLGVIAEAIGLPHAAEQAFREQLEIDERNLGLDSPLLANDLDDLADALTHLSRAAEADSVRRRASAIRARTGKSVDSEEEFFRPSARPR